MIKLLKKYLAGWKIVRVETRVQVKAVEVAETSISHWRSLPVNVAASQKVLGDPVLKMMVQLLEQESPAVMNVLPPGSSEIDVARSYGENVGYLQCLANLKSFGTVVAVTKEPAETFEAD